MLHLRHFLILLLFVTTSLTSLDASQLQELKWDKDQKKYVDEAVSLISQNPVSALMLFKDVLENQKKPKPNQRIWLEQQVTSLQPQALAVLQQDFEAAANAHDYHQMILIHIIADRIMKDSIKIEPTITEIKKKILTGDEFAGQIWRVSNVTAIPIKGSYSERPGSSGITLTPEKGFHLIRVKAQVENISAESDKPYSLWAFNTVERILGSTSKTIEPHRWLDDSFIYVALPNSELRPSEHVVQGSRLADITASKPDGRMIFPPKALKKNDSIAIDIIV